MEYLIFRQIQDIMITDRAYGSPVRQVGSWHDDEAWFVNSWEPWFNRGGMFSMGHGAGVFTFVRDAGSAWLNDGFRVVQIDYDLKIIKHELHEE